jgi:hypothetical protein
VSELRTRQVRELGTLFRDSWAVYRSRFLLFVALSAAVIVPVELVVDGIGMGSLTGSYDADPETSDTLTRGVVQFFVEYLVVTPIVTAICIHALDRIEAGERPSPGAVLTAGFEAFTPLFGAVVLAAVGVSLGLIALIVPGIFLFVRWYFVPQAVVVDGARGTAALSRSGDLVEGFWWRTLGIVLLVNVVAAIPGVLIIEPFAAIAEDTGDAYWTLVGSTLATSVTTPFVALLSTLLYYDLRARKAI